ncbi:ETX/MTX2 family pore-forming toxin [Streptomyces murinus]|uniref:ETX/MTX2 family pore-forming toxin n=1 Tax=Streptomyces murinus TaxID=33900 RepID=UPI000A36778F|nr:ETX/MTX2 family pore-forming toxin [Streptomyces murinus]
MRDTIARRDPLAVRAAVQTVRGGHMSRTTTVAEAGPGTTSFPSVEDIVRAWRKYCAGFISDAVDKKVYEREGTLTTEYYLRDISYSDVTFLPGEPWKAAALSYRNGSDVEQRVTYETSEEVSTTTTATVEQSVEREAKVEFTLKFPSESGITAGVSVKSARTDVNSTAKSVTNVRRISLPVRVPPHQVISAQVFATKKTQKVTWTARLAVLGEWQSEMISKGNSKVGVLADLPDLLETARQYRAIDLPGWEFRRMNEAQMRETFGNPAIDRHYQGEDPRRAYTLATGMVTGTMTFEDFVDITVEVRQLGTAYAGEAGAGVETERDVPDSVARDSVVIGSFAVAEPGEVVARQEDMLGKPVTVYEARWAGV